MVWMSTTSRKTKQDWLLAGWDILAKHGAASLTIESLTDTLQVTKGSFYHHFKNHQEYLAALLEFAEQEGVTVVIEEIETHKQTPMQKLDYLIRIVSEHNPYEIALRAWATHDAIARAVLERIDLRRQEYLLQLTSQLVDDPKRAQTIAQTLYMVYVGAGYIVPSLHGQPLIALFTELSDLLHLTPERKLS